MVQAQRYLDTLNPLVPYGPNDVKQKLHGWKDEEYPSAKLVPGETLRLDFMRQTDDMMAAQRQLLAFHASTIGGDYGKLLRYKPYKAQPLPQHERLAGLRYFKGAEIRGWSNWVKNGPMTDAPLKAAKNRAVTVAEEYTQASAARSAAKPEPRPAKAPKAALTPAEVTALRIYTTDVYREMNAVFRDFRVDRPTANWDKYSTIAKFAISGLGKLPKARNTVSYRGDSDVRYGGHSGILKLGATFRLPNFYSTTTLPERAFEGAVGYVFHNKKSGRWIQPFSGLRQESEILIPPGTRFRIVGEFHKEPDGSWRSVDGLPLSTSPEVAKFARDKKKRQMFLELDEIL
jgi:hypothetical protein